MIVTSCVVGIIVLVLVASRLEQKEFIADIQRALDGETEESLVRRRCREPEPAPEWSMAIVIPLRHSDEDYELNLSIVEAVQMQRVMGFRLGERKDARA